jgi:hypothetical protein
MIFAISFTGGKVLNLIADTVPFDNIKVQLNNESKLGSVVKIKHS